MKLFVYHTPELTPTEPIPDCAIAVDVLRATTTMATVLAAGGEAVQVFSDLDQLMHVSDQWPPERRLRAGERGGDRRRLRTLFAALRPMPSSRNGTTAADQGGIFQTMAGQAMARD